MTAGRSPRVLVDATSVPADRGGVGRYVDGLLGALSKVTGSALELIVVAQRTDVERYARVLPGAEVLGAPAAAAHRPARLAWEQTGLPLLAQQVNAQVLHAPFYTCPLRISCPVTVTVHDATFFTEPEHYDKSRRTFFRSAIKTSMRVGSASNSRISSSRVALLGTMTRAARRSEVLIALRKNVRRDLS